MFVKITNNAKAQLFSHKSKQVLKENMFMCIKQTQILAQSLHIYIQRYYVCVFIYTYTNVVYREYNTMHI